MKLSFCNNPLFDPQTHAIVKVDLERLMNDWMGSTQHVQNTRNGDSPFGSGEKASAKKAFYEAKIRDGVAIERAMLSVDTQVRPPDITIADGRHRLVEMLALGVREAEICLPKAQAGYFEQVYGLKEPALALPGVGNNTIMPNVP